MTGITVDQSPMYNQGWKAAQELIDNRPDATVQQMMELFKLDSHFSIGGRDCLQQYVKSGKSAMIKIAACVIVIDPESGYVLGATRRGTTDDWGIVGGKTDGEHPLLAACREFLEETAENLVHMPAYLGCFKDEEGWDIHVYIVTDRIEAKAICDKFRPGPREIEKDILVGLVPYSEMMVKTFAKFNIDLIPHIFKALL